MSARKNILKLEDVYIGKQIKYNDREFTLLTYRQTKEVIELVTDQGRWIKTNAFDLGLLLDDFEIIEPDTIKRFVKKVNSTPVFFSVQNEAIEKTQKALLNLLDEIEKGGTEYVKIDNTVKVAEAIIKTEKTKIEMVTSMNKLSENL